MNRRELLKLASAAALAQSLPRSLLGATSLADNPFALGIASGSPRHDGVVLWTRLLSSGNGFDNKPIAVYWEIADDEHFKRIVQKGSAPALPLLGYSVHVEVENLQPDRWYFYRFNALGNTSPVGRTRTFAAPGIVADKMRLAYASCQRWEHGYYAAWRHMQAEQLDAVFFVGDYIYEYAKGKNDIRSHDLAKPKDIAGYRDRYALYKSDPNLQGMHAQCPWLFTWDDHEVINDYAGLNGPGVSGDFAAQRAAAYQAFYENQPLRASVLTRALDGLVGGRNQGAETRIYGRASFGKLVDFHILDTRQYRTPQACSDSKGGASVRLDTCAELNAPERSMLGFEQERWLADGLKNSAERAPRWTVIVQETRFGQTINRGKNPTVSNDAWDGYPGTRQRIIDTLQSTRTPNPVVLGGDVHSNWVGHIKADYNKSDSANIGVEFTGTSISSNSSNAEHIPKRVEQNPHFIFGDGYKRGYGVVELSPRQLTTTLRAVSDVTQPDSGIETLAQFVVEHGKPELHRA
ncbi:alkaline phosphatase D family protein [Uliginosibacterium sp. H3]|uniref:Alkaline phosphatase D family protein n=1 Tax=Uliginosibacterium silvisoli TaxID=3114758 RepID=A0ABU6K8Z6_9RHOO|nr:alkaline phosphatase D family protein [Uliginosibacterium sp. H3]